MIRIVAFSRSTSLSSTLEVEECMTARRAGIPANGGSGQHTAEACNGKTTRYKHLPQTPCANIFRDSDIVVAWGGSN